MKRRMIYRLLQHTTSSASHGASVTTSAMITCKPACSNQAFGMSGLQLRSNSVGASRNTRPVMAAATLNIFHCSRVCHTPMQRSLVSSRTYLSSACATSANHIVAAASASEPEQQVIGVSSTLANTAADSISAGDASAAAAVPVPGTLAALMAKPPPGNVLDTWRLFLRTIHQLGHFPSTATEM